MFFSCSMNQEKGSIPIRLPEPGVNRAAGEYTYARILLITKAGYINIDSSTPEVYQDVAYSDGLYTIEDINPAYVYDIVIIFGHKDGGVFKDVYAYAVADDQVVTSGVNNAINMSIVTSDFTWVPAYSGKDSTNLLNIGGTIYVKSAPTAFQGVYRDGIELDIDSSAIGDIQSIGHGKDVTGQDELWLNSNSGIYPYNNGSINKDFSSGLPASTTMSISESYGLKLEGKEDGDQDTFIAFFQGEGSFGGIKMEPDKPYSDWEWTDKNSLMEDNADAKDMLEPLDNIVYDFVASGTYAYMATALPVAAFRISADTMGDIDDLPEEPTFNQLEKLVDTVIVRDGHQLVTKSLAIQGDKLYLGTESGLFYTGIDTKTGAQSVDADVESRIVGTEGKNILKLAPSTHGSYIAALTDGGVIIINDTAIIKEYMFYQGLPGQLSDIIWKDATLYISGSAGVVTVNAADL